MREVFSSREISVDPQLGPDVRRAVEPTRDEPHRVVERRRQVGVNGIDIRRIGYFKHRWVAKNDR